MTMLWERWVGRAVSVVKNTGYTLVTAAGPEGLEDSGPRGLEANCECGGTGARTWTTH